MTSDVELMPCLPDAVLPAQMSWGVRWDADTSGPRALMLAVLEDAVRCIEDGRRQPLNVCEALGFDVEAMRSRILIRGRNQPSVCSWVIPKEGGDAQRGNAMLCR